MSDISSLSVAALHAENNNLRQELQASQARFHQLVSQLSQASACNDGSWDWNVQTNEVYLSPRWKEMLGYENYELPNAFSTWTDLIHPDDLDDALRIVNEFLESTNLFYQSVHRLRHKNGNWIWIFDRGVAVRDAENRVIRFSGSHTDITLLRNFDEDLLQREREFNSIIQINPDGIVTFSNENKISTVNPAFLKMTGFSLSELQNLDKSEFDIKMLAISHSENPYQKDIKNGESALIWLINGDESEISFKKNSRFNFKSRHKNHRILKMTQHELNTINTPVILYFHDVTLEMEMDQLKTNFLSVAAHELRMPIASIYGYSELLIHRDFDELTRRDILQAIHGLCTSVVELISHLLDLARIEAQCTNDACDFYPLTLVIKEILDEFKVYGDFRKIEVYYFVDEASVIYADKDQLKRAVINLLSNAVKYSLNGQHVELEIRSRTNHDKKEQIGIIVKDKGIGIAAENIPHIFERFWRADNVSDIIGTGLGMALVKEIADLHHADIDVQSELGKGTTVSMWLPVKPVLE